jgi:REP element-mobilizing transposase RayT
MTKARKTIINVNDTPYYHVMGRTVRRSFLFGVDKLTGNDYSHRKQWIVDKLAELSRVYMIDVCAYAVMSNHYHLVLKINHEQAKRLSDEEVMERWMRIFKGNVLVQRYLKGECKTESEKLKVKETVEEWRLRLSDISWFMRCLNETIAHKANEEDKCTGHFWEGRFKSQALLNEQALLSCMAYVDLNPIRAGLAQSVDMSDHTGISQRIREINISRKSEFTSPESNQKKQKEQLKPVKLADFVGSKDKEGIPYLLMDYLELVDWTGRAIRDDKKGYIPESEPKIISKLGFTLDIWMKSVSQFSDHFYSHIGSDDQLKAVCNNTELNWLAGSKSCREIYKN